MPKVIYVLTLWTSKNMLMHRPSFSETPTGTWRNRGRRINIRIRGIPEAEGSENVALILESVFNDLLGQPASTHIKLDRAHRALRSKGASSLPRDIVFCVHNFALKERIMAKARTQQKTVYAGHQIQFPDLSWITLQKRRHLKPLLALLREQDIIYR